MRLAVIPARGGSKRIPRKNIRLFGGRPMIAWSIQAALDSRCFDELIVSTDDEEIATLARALGAQTPFLRPANLADEHTGTTAVVAHAVQWMVEAGRAPEHVCCIYATAPFVQAADLQRGLQLLQQAQADYALSVTSFPAPIQRALRITPRGRVEMMQPEHMQTRSQDLEPAWHDAAQFYWGRAQAWLEQQPVFGAASVPVVLPRHRVQDIDTAEDWAVAEAMFMARRDQPDKECP